MKICYNDTRKGPKGVIFVNEQQKLLMAETNGLSDEMIKKIRAYVAELKHNSAINSAPKELMPKDEKELEKMLEEADEDIKNGNVSSIEEVKAELDQAL
jgi:hypothetical protein